MSSKMFEDILRALEKKIPESNIYYGPGEIKTLPIDVLNFSVDS